MGIPVGGSYDLAEQVLTGTLSSTAAGAGANVQDGFNLAVWGTFTATLVQERSFDGGATWTQITQANGDPVQITAPTSIQWFEPVSGVVHRVRCTAYASGTVFWRLSR